MRFAPFAWLAFVMAVWAAPRVYAETAAPADVAWAEIQSSGLLDRNNWDDFGAKTRRERMERVEQAALQLKAKGLAFFAAYPADPRRWLLVEKMMALRPRFTKSYGPDFEKKNDYVIDEPAAAAWEEQLKQLEAEMLAAGDLPADQRERVEFKQLFRVLMGEIRRASKGEVVDWKEMVESVARFGVKYPHSENLLTVIDSLMRFYEPNHTREENEQVWHAFAASPNAELAEVARPKAKIYAHSMELAFTAVDGQKVDLRALRGKVVLIDFWATWCGSCIQELPNIKKVYAAYHDKGFEAIGVALENPQINPNDSPEVSAAKMAKAKKGLTDFVAKQDLPWPQYFDDANAKNELSERYRIVGIPAGFLLDQDGNVVSLYSRGERLEADVKRLLKL